MNLIKSISQTYLTEILGVKKPKVLLMGKTSWIKESWKITDAHLSELRKYADVDVVVVDSATEEQLAKQCEGYDYLMLNMDFLPFPDSNKMDKLTEKFYNHPSIKNLKGINVDMTDGDFFSPEIAKQRGLLLQTTRNAVTQSVAESAVCEIMVHAKGRHNSYKNNQDCILPLSKNLRGEVAGIIGNGHIGSVVGKMLEGIGMKVLYNDIVPKGENTPIEKLFRESQVISIHIPALQLHTNKSNRGFINEKLLNLCTGTILINLATDIIVDNDAIRKAIKSKKILGYSVEPGRKITENLKNIPEVHISPCSWSSNESKNNVRKIWIQNMITALQGNPQNIWN